MKPRGLAWEGAVSLVGAGLGAVSTFVIAAVVGRSLGPSNTGTFFSVIGVFTICFTIVKFGADTGLVRTLSQQLALGRQADLRPTVWLAIGPVLVGGLVGGVAMWLAAPWLSSLLNGGEQVGLDTDLYRSLSWFVLPGAAGAVLLGGTRGVGGVLPFTVLQNIVLPVSRLALLTGAIALIGSVHAILWAWSIPLIVLLLASAWLLDHRLHFVTNDVQRTSQSNNRTLAKEFWVVASARGVAAVFEILIAWGDVLLVAAMLSARDAGIYALATRCVRAGQIVDSAARIAVAPRISRLVALEDHEGLNSIYTLATRGMMLLAWPFYATVAVFSGTILSLFGNGFREGSATLSILALALMASTSAGMVQSILLMGGMGRWQILNKASALVVLVGANLVLLPRLGLVGAALAWMASVLSDTILAVIQTRGMLGKALQLRKLALAAALSGGLVFVIGLGMRLICGDTTTGLIWHFVATAPVYLFLLMCLRGRLGLLSRPRPFSSDRTAAQPR